MLGTSRMVIVQNLWPACPQVCPLMSWIVPQDCIPWLYRCAGLSESARAKQISNLALLTRAVSSTGHQSHTIKEISNLSICMTVQIQGWDKRKLTGLLRKTCVETWRQSMQLQAHLTWTFIQAGMGAHHTGTMPREAGQTAAPPRFESRSTSVFQACQNWRQGSKMKIWPMNSVYR